MGVFSQLYDAIHLNLGFKRCVRHLALSIIPALEALDRFLLFRISRAIDAYRFGRIVYHYGADYRWNDQQSQNLDKNRSSYGYGHIHYGLVRNQRPRRILCIGSMYGFIPYMLAKACMDNRMGHVDFVDAGYDETDQKDAGKHIFGQGFWKRVDTKKHFSYILDSSYITTYVMTTKAFAQKFPNRRYDYIYLDGDHRYTGAKFDFQTFWPRLNERGYITLHDIHFEATALGITFEQWRLWEKLVQTHPYKIEFYNHYSGLGIIQKLTNRPKRFRKHFQL